MLMILGIVLVVVGALGLLNLIALTLPVSVIVIVCGVLLTVFGRSR
jgi:uncharacterized membrane protein